MIFWKKVIFQSNGAASAMVVTCPKGALLEPMRIRMSAEFFNSLLRSKFEKQLQRLHSNC